MSGHSKWAQTKHKKAAVDARRGKVFTRIIKEITVTARMGGGDPDTNPRLRGAIASAKGANMPQENITKAIKRGMGELAGVTYEPVIYEGYGPGGAAVLVEALTDNRNRISADIRYIFSKNHGNLGESGCVSWLFQHKGYFLFDKKEVGEETVMEVALEGGADDVTEDDGRLEVICEPSAFEAVKRAFEERGLKYILGEVTMVPQTYVKLAGREAEQMLKLMSAMEECEDVQHVYANFDIPDSIIEEFRE